MTAKQLRESLTRPKSGLIEKVRPMLHEWLVTLGFDTMAQEVLTLTDWTKIKTAARVVARNANNEQVTARLRLLGLL